MSIEQAGPAVSPKTSTTQDNRATKGRAHDAGDAPEGSFFSLLSAVSPTVVDQAVPAISPPTSTAQDTLATKGKAGDVPEGGVFSLLGAVSPTVVDQAVPAISPTTSTAQDTLATKGKAGDVPEGGVFSLLGAVGSAVGLPVAEPGLSAPPSDNEKELKDEVSLLVPAPQVGLVEMSNPSSTRVDSGAMAGVDLVAQGERLNALTPAVVPTQPSADETLVSPAQLMLAAGNSVQSEGVQGFGPRAQKTLQARPSQGDEAQANLAHAQSVSADLTLGDVNGAQSVVGMGIDPRAQKLVQARRTLGEELRADATQVKFDSRAGQVASELEGAGKEVMLAKLPLAGDFSARLLEPVERTRGKSFGSVGVSGAEGGWTQYAHHARPVGDLPSNFNAMVTTPMQTQVADKVSYWVTQGIQNAELKLDGFGTEPVEVSIFLKGGEAHVGFRSDQPEVRQMLEGALSQLKDALDREGVLLSGVTVGGSGANGSGRQQEPRQGSSSNRGAAVGAPTASEPRTLRASTSVGRSLDIFV